MAGGYVHLRNDSSADTITDFASGVDQIDLSDFAAVTAANVAYVGSQLRIDTNGDLVYDMTVISVGPSTSRPTSSSANRRPIFRKKGAPGNRGAFFFSQSHPADDAFGQVGAEHALVIFGDQRPLGLVAFVEER